MNAEHMIEIKEHHIIPLVKKVYEMSVPVGMGFLQPHDANLGEGYLKMVRDNIENTAEACVVYMDYVNGRQCKFNVWRDLETGRYWIRDSWYDHSEDQFAELLSILNEG